jgi:steroid delta-isomerase-like uncharacterized protein
MSRAELERLDDEGMGAWEKHDGDAFLGLFAEEFVWQDDTVPEPMRSKGEARRYFQSWMTAFPDFHVSTTNRVIGEDAVAAEVEFRGTNTGPLEMAGNQIPATGKNVVGHGCYFARVQNGKIVEFHSHPDAAGMMMQLGLLPGG